MSDEKNYEIPMPSLGADMDEGKLVEWKIKEGDKIRRGQIIAVVETQKAAVEIESFKEGKLLQLLAKPSSVIRVGQPIALMSLSEQEHPLPIHKEPMDRTGPEIDLRKSIARSMSRSKREIPHYYLRRRISVHKTLAWLDKVNSNRSAASRILWPSVLATALARALKEHPNMNGVYLNDKFITKSEINIGMAIALKAGGVMAPCLLQSQAKSLIQIDHELKDLIERTRQGILKNQELTEGTITLTNLGELGADEVFGIIFPPQVALVGFGRIINANSSQISSSLANAFMETTLSGDHRVSDGISGSRFLESLEMQITSPEALLE